MDSAPLLYHSLLGCPFSLPKKLIGLIVEQVPFFFCFIKIDVSVVFLFLELTTLAKLCLLKELLAYGLMEARGSVFSAEMQTRVITILLDEIYCSKEHFQERSRILVRKAGTLRARGVVEISSCLDTLSEAISLLVSFNLILPFVIFKEKVTYINICSLNH